MCGIVGYIGRRNSLSILIDGLKRLEYRGYDSAGVAVINDDGEINSFKKAGKVKDIEELFDLELLSGTTGIGHTRWATHGEPNDNNAHPHFDMNRNIAIVHNGIIENYKSIKRRLKAEGFKFFTDTDTEILANLIEYHFIIKMILKKQLE